MEKVYCKDCKKCVHHDGHDMGDWDECRVFLTFKYINKTYQMSMNKNQHGDCEYFEKLIELPYPKGFWNKIKWFFKSQWLEHKRRNAVYEVIKD